MIRVGILSDTHLYEDSPAFHRQVEACFADCRIIFHAGDLTTHSILAAFGDRKVYAVHGNMCDQATCNRLPGRMEIELGGFNFAITHRCGRNYDFESELIGEFPEADCIIYGHTHQARCTKIGPQLLINPGSFRGTGRYGAQGSYAILEIDQGLRAQIHQLTT